MAIGRVLCVALPFILTVCSLICILVAGLTGVANKDLYMFRVNTTNLEFNPSELDQLEDLISGRSLISADDILRREPIEGGLDWHDLKLLEVESENGKNVTVDDLGLGHLYDIFLWGYCSTDSEGERSCTKAKFDWASHILSDTVTQFKQVAALAGQDVVLPDAVETAMNAFAAITRWTEIAYVAAVIALVLELFFGIFAACSRVLGCVTFIVAAITSLLVIGAAALSTAMSVIVVGTVESTAQWYGVRSNFNTTFLSFAWLAAAFALGAGFFWMFTICCCASSNHTSSRGFKAHSVPEGEKNPPTGAYQPLGEQHEMTPPPFYSSGQQWPGRPRQSVGPRSDMAYEPYSHNRV